MSLSQLTHIHTVDAENKAISKQIVINHINLPDDIIKNIYSFIFYDKEIYNRKKNISANITNQIARLVRLPGGRQFYQGHWSIYYEDLDSDIDFENPEIMTTFYKKHSFQLQAINCMKCGNYIFHNGLYEMNLSNTYLYCHCPGEAEITMN